jgi:hypothetical protein
MQVSSISMTVDSIKSAPNAGLFWHFADFFGFFSVIRPGQA